MEQIIIQLLAGALGGNAAGALMKEKSLGIAGNSVAGIIGGGLGGQILGVLGMAGTGGMDLGGILQSVASGGVGGAILMTAVGVLRTRLAK